MSTTTNQHPEHPVLDDVHHRDQSSPTVLDGKYKDEGKEGLDIFGGLAGGQPLEEDNEHLLHVRLQSLRGYVLVDGLDEGEAFIVVGLAGDQLL